MQLYKCSTPRGIKDQNGPRTRETRVTYQVLNASRHQRSKRVVRDMEHKISKACSTPRGIKDQNGTRPKTSSTSKTCAQRLAASKIKTAPATHPQSKNRNVLNASRHQRSKRKTSSKNDWHSSTVLNASRHQRSKRGRTQR